MKKILLFVLILAVLACAVVFFWGYKDLHRSIAHTKSSEYIEIPRGSNPSTVVKRLALEGVIKHEWPLMFYMKFTGAGSRLRAGEYVFPSPISPISVLRRLEQGEQRTIRLTIIEGWTRWDIANALVRIPELHLSNADEALELMNDVSLVRSIDPEATNLEGYLYPDTYEFPLTTSPKLVIDIMVKRFLKEWSPERADKARALNLSPRQIVTTASLIETEAKLKEERPRIASVIYNRLQRNIPLGVDSTIIYASKLAGKWKNNGRVYKSDVDRASPYNTRLHAGLPPGPIASAGESCLEAALNPEQTSYLYYVREPSRDDGAHNFYSSDSDFNKGVQALREWERHRDQDSSVRNR
jgi:peptidoglycan lytic transglycosylase G